MKKITIQIQGSPVVFFTLLEQRVKKNGFTTYQEEGSETDRIGVSDKPFLPLPKGSMETLAKALQGTHWFTFNVGAETLTFEYEPSLQKFVVVGFRGETRCLVSIEKVEVLN